VSAVNDGKALDEAGFSISWILQKPMFYRAMVTRGSDAVKLEWVYDSAFRFFPVVEDAEFGFCLHRFDGATNKVLAAANRNEPPDLIDLLQLHVNWLPLGQLVWAACGKDPGLTPEFVLDNIQRNSCVRQEQLDLEQLAVPITPRELKEVLRAAIDDARRLFVTLPAEEIGACYVSNDGVPVQWRVNRTGVSAHYGSVGGAWPVICFD
jgi:hypothetical protein